MDDDNTSTPTTSNNSNVGALALETLDTITIPDTTTMNNNDISLDDILSALNQLSTISDTTALELADIHDRVEDLVNRISTHDPLLLPPTTSTSSSNNIKLAELHKENTVLNNLIKQYETSIDIVKSMVKTHQQKSAKEVRELREEYERVLGRERDLINSLQNDNAALQQSLSKSMVSVRQALLTDEKDSTEMVTMVNKLMKENEGLRELLEIQTVMR